MQEYSIENQYLKLSAASHGAEMRSLIRKTDGRELLWQADPAFWGRTSPILFPLVGNYRNKTSYYDGKEFQMSQHGFARDSEFSLQRQSEDALWFTLEDSEETKKKYPFSFCLSVGYELSGHSVRVSFRVKNTDTGTIYFSVGGHPAFCCDLETDGLELEKEGRSVKGPLVSGIIEGDGSGCLSDRQKELALSDGRLPLSNELFAEDALILEGRQADAVTLLEKGDQRILKVLFDAPLFGLWSPAGKNAPFVCIEPWYGRCDKVTFSGSLKDREYGNALEAGEEFLASYQIMVYEKD